MTALLIIAGLAIYLALVCPALMRLAGANSRLRAQRESDLAGQIRSIRPRPMVRRPITTTDLLDAYERTDQQAPVTDMEAIR